MSHVLGGVLQTGPHAGYVEAAWGISAAVLGALVLASLLSARRWRRRAERRRPPAPRP